MGWAGDAGVGRSWELPFAGREAELRDFEGDLSAAEGRRCRMVVVSGAHGEGKSRLLDEFAAAARQRRFTVVSARGVDETGSPPMWCWRHLVTDLINGLDALSRASIVGAHGLALGGLLDVDPSASDGTDRESGSAAFRRMEAIALTLRDVARRGPVLVMVDDAEWVDASSLRALAFVSGLVRDTALVIVAAVVPSTDDDSAYRVAPALSEVVRQPITRLVELTALSEGSVDALVTARRGIA